MTQALARVAPAPIAPGAHVELRDAIWRVVQVDLTSSGKSAWRCVGVSEIVRDREAVFLEELEDPRVTKLVRDTSPQHRAGLLYLEALLRDVPPPDDAIYVGHKAAMDVLDFQLEPAWRALQRPRQRILRHLTVEVTRDDGVALLTADPDRMQRALADARKEESAWPQHQYLWPNHPVLGWIGDRMRSQFGRHTAAIVVSGLLPNRRGQAMVHRWYAARYDGDRLAGVEPFEETAAALGLGRNPLPNANVELDLTPLQRRLPSPR